MRALMHFLIDASREILYGGKYQFKKGSYRYHKLRTEIMYEVLMKGNLNI